MELHDRDHPPAPPHPSPGPVRPAGSTRHGLFMIQQLLVDSALIIGEGHATFWAGPFGCGRGGGRSRIACGGRGRQALRPRRPWSETWYTRPASCERSTSGRPVRRIAGVDSHDSHFVLGGTAHISGATALPPAQCPPPAAPGSFLRAFDRFLDRLGALAVRALVCKKQLKRIRKRSN